MQRLKKPSDSRQRNIILTFIRVIKSVRRSLRRLRRPMPYCLIRIRDASMISLVMRHLTAQAAEPVALISQAWIWGIFLGTFSEISSEVEEAVAEEMVLHRVQMSVSVLEFLLRKLYLAAQRSLNSTIRRHALHVEETELSLAHLLRPVPSVMVQVRLSDRASLCLE